VEGLHGLDERRSLLESERCRMKRLSHSLFGSLHPAQQEQQQQKKKRSLVVSSISRLLQCIKCTDHLAVGTRRVLRLHVQRRQHALCLHVPLVDVRAVKDSQQKQISEQEPVSHACASRRTKTLQMRKPNRLVTDSVIGCKGLLLLSLFEPRISLLFVLLGAL
jgi:hypothetical protein